MNNHKSEISIFVKSYWNYFLELENEFQQTQKYVSFDKYNERTYSVEYLKLMQAVCSEIDVVAKEIANYFDQDFKKIKFPTIKHWGYVISNNMTQLSTFKVIFNNDIEIYPWDKFGYTRYKNKKDNITYKLDAGCQKPRWWDDYCKIKHNRTQQNEEGNIYFTKASLKNMILSISALYSLEKLYMEIITPEIGPDCYIEESKLFE